MNEKLLKRKWSKFLRLRPIFSFIPFLDFVLVAGSLALGNVHENSDFDVIVGARSGRIFTVRGFCIALFWPLGLFQRRTDIKKDARDKVCFSHFVTPAAYRLSPPYNEYWKKLYQNLVPVYGGKKKIEEFFGANDWLEKKPVIGWKRFQPTIFNPVRIFLEFILHEFIGDILEKIAKKLQMSRIGLEKSIKRGESVYKPRLRFSDEELEFHPDTRRIEEMFAKNLSIDRFL